MGSCCGGAKKEIPPKDTEAPKINACAPGMDWVNDPPPVSAQCWSVTDGKTGKLIFGSSHMLRREMASLTKIMTFYTVIRLIEKFGTDINSEKVKASAFAAGMGGTSAKLKEGDEFILKDLFFGMMLPSGNDAAVCLAEHFGQKSYTDQIANSGNNEAGQNQRLARKFFVHELNQSAKIVGMKHSKFDNPTGLGDRFNKSTAEEIGLLCSAAMKLPLFREVVATKEYKCSATDSEGNPREYFWENTNKMLERGYCGIKTGITPNAGPCLASGVERDGEFLIVILLQSGSMDARWTETENLVTWTLDELRRKVKQQIKQIY